MLASKCNYENEYTQYYYGECVPVIINECAELLLIDIDGGWWTHYFVTWDRNEIKYKIICWIRESNNW